MPGRRKPGKSIKNPKVYEELRSEGMPKSSAAAISNSMAKKASHVRKPKKK